MTLHAASRNVPVESPLSLKEIKRLRPTVPKWLVEQLTRDCCTPFPLALGPIGQTGYGHFRGINYLLSEFDAALLKRNRDRAKSLPAGTEEFENHEGKWVSDRRLPGGIVASTAKLMYRDGLIRAPRHWNVLGVALPRRFWHLEDVSANLRKYSTPKIERETCRTAAQLERLPDDELINRREAKSLGFSASWLTLHSDIRHKRKKLKPVVPPTLGRLILGQLRDRICSGPKETRRITCDPWYRIGDLRELRRLRDNPPIPSGGRLIRRGIEAELKFEGIVCSRKSLAQLVRSGSIVGGEVAVLDRMFREKKSLWMLWSERTKLPTYSSPGKRVCWVDGEDWHPELEAYELAGFRSVQQMRWWMPIEYCGHGRPSPLLGGRVIRCRRGPIPHKLGNDLVVCAGKDLRDIAEKLTGVRPKAPTPPLQARAAGNRNLAPAKSPATEAISAPASGLVLRGDERYALIDGSPAVRKLTLAEYDAIATLLHLHQAGIRRPRSEDLDDDDHPARRRILNILVRDPEYGRFVSTPGGQKNKGFAVINVSEVLEKP